MYGRKVKEAGVKNSNLFMPKFLLEKMLFGPMFCLSKNF